MPRRSVLSHDEQLMKHARAVARLETKARELRARLKLVTTDLKSARKLLRTYTQSLTDQPWNERAPPMRVFNEH